MRTWLNVMMTCLLFCACVAGIGVLNSPAQAADERTDVPASGKVEVQLKDLPPALILAARLKVVSEKIPAATTVVIVADPASYVHAIAGWNIRLRYPVLYDDGSIPSALRIARFVRAFKPEQVVRFRFEQADPSAWPDDVARRRELLLQTAAHAWSDDTQQIKPDQLAAHWKQIQFTPPGVIVADVDDPTWTAALALSASRGEPMVWWALPKERRGDVSGFLEASQVQPLVAAIEEALKKSPWSYKTQGDDIEAVTLCLNGPIKVHPAHLPPNDPMLAVALTDLVGRSVDPASGDFEKTRWAWCGQIVGDQSQAAYMAMCSIFLSCSSAWLFDGYDDSTPWSEFDATSAAAKLDKVGIKTYVDDNGRNGIADFRRRAAGIGIAEPGTRGLDVGLVTVNTSGQRDSFDLKPGQGRVGDLPILRTPTAVYFVHSFSAMTAGSIDTIAGRWLERGAFVFVGSIHEPTLQGFLNTPTTTARLASGSPIGSAVRFDTSPVWKIALVGDPLMRLQGAPKTIDAPIPLSKTVPLSQELADQIKERDFAAALRTLTLLGRDDQCARLAKAILGEPGEKLSAQAALAALTSVYFVGDFKTLRETFEAAAPTINADPSLWPMLDIPWHALGNSLNTLTSDEAAFLNSLIRSTSKDRDIAEAAQAARAARQRENK